MADIMTTKAVAHRLERARRRALPEVTAEELTKALRRALVRGEDHPTPALTLAFLSGWFSDHEELSALLHEAATCGGAQ